MPLMLLWLLLLLLLLLLYDSHTAIACQPQIKTINNLNMNYSFIPCICMLCCCCCGLSLVPCLSVAVSHRWCHRIAGSQCKCLDMMIVLSVHHRGTMDKAMFVIIINNIKSISVLRMATYISHPQIDAHKIKWINKQMRCDSIMQILSLEIMRSQRRMTCMWRTRID